MIKEFKVPHTLVLLYGMIVLAYILTWILPAGMFETAVNADGQGGCGSRDVCLDRVGKTSADLDFVHINTSGLG